MRDPNQQSASNLNGVSKAILSSGKSRSKKESQISKDKEAEKNSCRKQVQRNFKSIDLFGQSVNLTWNGEDQYKTGFGASISFVLLLILLAFSSYKLYYLVNRFNPNLTKTTLIRSPEEEKAFRP